MADFSDMTYPVSRRWAATLLRQALERLSDPCDLAVPDATLTHDGPLNTTYTICFKPPFDCGGPDALSIHEWLHIAPEDIDDT